MTETLWVAIIAGAIGVIGSLVGTYLQARVSERNTKIQIQANERAQSAQFKHDLELQQISRRIDLQSSYLKPLQEKISECYKLHLDMEQTLRSIRSWYGDPPDPIKNAFLMEKIPDFKYTTLVDKLEESYKLLRSTQSEIEIIMTKCSDAKVNSLVIDFTFMKISSLSSTISSLKSLSGNSWGHESNIEENPISLSKVLKQLSDARDCISETHAEIERILSGDRETK